MVSPRYQHGHEAQHSARIGVVPDKDPLALEVDVIGVRFPIDAPPRRTEVRADCPLEFVHALTSGRKLSYFKGPEPSPRNGYCASEPEHGVHMNAITATQSGKKKP